ncbi:NAD(P)-dependent alcohol dehydrogenase [Demequina sp. SYSU T00192]|uniref:NAD(P)-dependent alcohol dehydrogenase n=1 Tax=Demequina litoralis TaxID=3051660 RepID=A0ABT8GC85_9MICO|nr:NAD(P)-dependent alcohol dehydrogenase [Demequina sp. SYSU T00192]MDN4476748.1 NAD(P)-dependent alcohol dehydrogenase [Demequina sp. SYSU T00192]
MKAVTYDRYAGPETHELREIPIPEPGEGQVRIRVHAAGLNPWDWHLYRGDPWLARFSQGLFSPGERVVGADAAGTVDALGPGVDGLAVGDRVFGFLGFGACADYAVADASKIARTPDGVTDEEAAAVPIGAITALGGLEDGGGCEGRSVLVIGASGGVGHMAVQVARVLGASRVVAVCSGRNASMVSLLGADRVIDYTREDVLDCGETFDVIYDTVGTTSLVRLRRILEPDGVYLGAGGLGGGPLLGPAWAIFSAKALGPFVRRRVVVVGTEPSRENLTRMAGWLAEGRVRPIIQRTYPLDRTAEALAALEAQHVAGKVVVAVA